MRLVILESPYAGDVEANVAFAKLCMRHALLNGDAPMASHLLYTESLRDELEGERALGMLAGWEWGKAAQCWVFYLDRGFSEGMRRGLRVALALNKSRDYRWLKKPDNERVKKFLLEEIKPWDPALPISADTILP